MRQEGRAALLRRFESSCVSDAACPLDRLVEARFPFYCKESAIPCGAAARLWPLERLAGDIRDIRRHQRQHAWRNPTHNLARRSRSAFITTDTDDRLIAAAAMIGLSSQPNHGYSTPAATGMPSAL